ncbi:MAG: hypothetical protein U0T73_08610 [Chitinophagales bacterium]
MKLRLLFIGMLIALLGTSQSVQLHLPPSLQTQFSLGAVDMITLTNPGPAAHTIDLDFQLKDGSGALLISGEGHRFAVKPGTHFLSEYSANILFVYGQGEIAGMLQQGLELPAGNYSFSIKGTDYSAAEPFVFFRQEFRIVAIDNRITVFPPKVNCPIVQLSWTDFSKSINGNYVLQIAEMNEDEQPAEALLRRNFVADIRGVSTNPYLLNTDNYAFVNKQTYAWQVSIVAADGSVLAASVPDQFTYKCGRDSNTTPPQKRNDWICYRVMHEYEELPVFDVAEFIPVSFLNRSSDTLFHYHIRAYEKMEKKEVAASGTASMRAGVNNVKIPIPKNTPMVYDKPYQLSVSTGDGTIYYLTFFYKKSIPAVSMPPIGSLK